MRWHSVLNPGQLPKRGVPHARLRDTTLRLRYASGTLVRAVEERCLFFGAAAPPEAPKPRGGPEPEDVAPAAATPGAPTPDVEKPVSDRWEGCSVLDADEMREHMPIIGPEQRFHKWRLYPAEEAAAAEEANAPEGESARPAATAAVGGKAATAEEISAALAKGVPVPPPPPVALESPPTSFGATGAGAAAAVAPSPPEAIDELQSACTCLVAGAGAGTGGDDLVVAAAAGSSRLLLLRGGEPLWSAEHRDVEAVAIGNGY